MEQLGLVANQLRPAGIKVDRKRKMLVIHWNDGHVSEYGLANLREACPCAECRERLKKMRKPAEIDILNIPLTPVKSDDVKSVQLVGNYALQITWGDGHKFGIYSWDYLRALRPPGQGP